jgi:hypothetical protein
VPLPSVAIAVNCDVAPTAGADPVTAIEETVVDDVGELPHATAVSIDAAVIAKTIVDRAFENLVATFITSSLFFWRRWRSSTMQRQCHRDSDTCDERRNICLRSRWSSHAYLRSRDWPRPHRHRVGTPTSTFENDTRPKARE